MIEPTRRPRVLVLARNYPSNVLPTLGLWTQRLVLASSRSADPTVIAPVPYAPPFLPEAYAKYRRVLPRRKEASYDVFHPRVLLPPGHALQRFEAGLMWPTVRRLADRLHAERSFDLIHAHFIFPDGVLAARLGRRYGIPVLTTEPAAWRPWLDEYPSVRAQVVRALPWIRRVLPVSTWLERNIVEAVGSQVATDVVHNVVDDSVFTPLNLQNSWDPDQILFVGLIRRVKGLDILVQAVAMLAPLRPKLRLLVLGGAFYRGYQRDEAEVRRLIADLGLEGRIHFAGESSPSEVASAMRRSALLVVPSRRETFSVVAAEALACGTPVVATRCGGPEDIITPQNGRLVPPEDPEALARAIDETLEGRDTYDRWTLHRDSVARFGMDVIARRLGQVYQSLTGSPAISGR